MKDLRKENRHESCYGEVIAFSEYGFAEVSETEQAVESLLLALKAKDEYTLKHSIRVARYSAVIAREMGLNQENIAKAYLGGLLHDIGKIYVPDAILSKQGPLTGDEFRIIKYHPLQSEKICKPITALRDILPIIRAHHERMDGCGYPDRLAGADIPLIARIIAVADTLDATTSNRSYQKRMPISKVRSILENGAGKQWDEDVVRVVLNGFVTGCFKEALLPAWPFNYATVLFRHDLHIDTSFAC